MILRIKYILLGMYLGQALACGYFGLADVGFLKGMVIGLIWPWLAPVVIVLALMNLV